jgi:NAD(P)-dependent dehydrogenase (short-subunit alcohol dehydrogenase family)
LQDKTFYFTSTMIIFFNHNIIKIKMENRAKSSEFLNKRVIITGASSGIGMACAYYFLNAGAKVVLCGRDIDTLKQIGAKFPDQGAAIKVDLSGDLQMFDFKTSVIELLGGIDLMINCAGVMFDGDLEKTFPQDYDYTVDVNLRCVFALMLHFKEFFTRQTTIINVSCLNGTRPQCGMMSYCISKAGLEMLTKYAAAEFADIGVRVNAVTTSSVDTNCQRYCGVGDEEYNQFKTRVSKNIPMGRMAKPDDVAKTIIFLASDRASKITGQVIKVDGGRSLTSSGYIPWKGLKNMNSRFEPDDYTKTFKLKNVWTGFSLNKEGKATVYPQTEQEIDDLLSQANWATRLSEAHEKVVASYKSIDQNNNYLKKKFVNKNA